MAPGLPVLQQRHLQQQPGFSQWPQRQALDDIVQNAVWSEAEAVYADQAVGHQRGKAAAATCGRQSSEKCKVCSRLLTELLFFTKQYH